VGDATASSGYRLTELLAAISLATDLGTGQPMGGAIRTCLLSMAAAEELDVDARGRSEVHTVALLSSIGCTSDAPELAQVAGGDNLAFMADMATVIMGTNSEAAVRLVRTLGRGRSPLQRARLVAAAFGDPRGPERSLTAHCEVGARLADRLDVGPEVVQALAHAYERWDGRGVPDGLAGDDIPLSMRIIAVTRDVVIVERLAGREAAAAFLAGRRGTAYSPTVVDAVTAVMNRAATGGGVAGDNGSAWDEVLDAEPAPVRVIGPMSLDRTLEALGDFADLRSTRTRGRSARVAVLADGAARAAGLAEGERALLGRAARVADLGAVGVPTGLWDEADPSASPEAEQVRMHPYLTERVLGRCRGLEPIAELAGTHHERLDGSGYHRGLAAPHLSRASRLLAAADRFATLTGSHGRRPALSLESARDALWADAAAGRLDGDAVEAVLAASGQVVRHHPSPKPAGLSDREVEVLRLISRGLRSREVAEQLFISRKTVEHHIEHIYAKIGVRTRPAAVLFAMEHDLLAGT
jgi:HD-GYP domain-containing protein (c-di-GMP phosphodiesterase class II)